MMQFTGNNGKQAELASGTAGDVLDALGMKKGAIAAKIDRKSVV